MYITFAITLLLILFGRNLSTGKTYTLLALAGALTLGALNLSPLAFASVVTAQSLLLFALVYACNSRFQITFNVQLMQVIPAGA